MNDLDLEVEKRLLNYMEIAKLKESKIKMIDMEKLKKDDLILKYKAKWISDGDENSSFFHNSLRIKNLRTCMKGLMINVMGYRCRVYQEQSL